MQLKAGGASLRSTLLTADNRIQWGRLLELFDEAGKAKDGTEEAEAAGGSASTEAAKAAAMNDAVGSLLGSSQGGALRKALLRPRLVEPRACS